MPDVRKRKSFRRFSYAERRVIETMREDGRSIYAIAHTLKRSTSSIHHELKKGNVLQLDAKTGNYKQVYFADVAQRKSDALATRAGNTKIKAGSQDAKILEKLIKSGYSPYAAIQVGIFNGQLKTRVCESTVYNYIHWGVLNITSLDLPQGFNKPKKQYVDFHRREKYDRCGHISIEDRPKAVLSRSEFGHWEADTVCSVRPSKRVIFTMVERKTRFLIAFLLDNRKQASIACAMDEIEAMFKKYDTTSIFKSLTLDNGVEFADTQSLISSYKNSGKRVGKIYYVHPFCSSERGSCEVIHRFIRRRWPKNYNFDNLSTDEVSDYVSWINNYPRKIFGGKSARDIFLQEIGACPRAA